MCVYFHLIIYYIHRTSVRRVHWLRARAQLMRWQEEETLSSYEMQWTVRFFSYQSKMWSALQNSTEAGVMSNIGAGAIAYAKRKQWTWDQLCHKSDQTFTVVNKAYKSPL